MWFILVPCCRPTDVTSSILTSLVFITTSRMGICPAWQPEFPILGLLILIQILNHTQYTWIHNMKTTVHLMGHMGLAVLYNDFLCRLSHAVTSTAVITHYSTAVSSHNSKAASPNNSTAINPHNSTAVISHNSMTVILHNSFT